MKSLLVQCSWLQWTEILVCVIKTVSVGITRSLLLSCGPAQVSVTSFAISTFFSSPSATLCGLLHLVPCSLHFPTIPYCPLFLCDLTSLGLFFFLALGYEGWMGMNLGHWIPIFPSQHKIKSYFYHLWVAWCLRIGTGLDLSGPKGQRSTCLYLDQ